MTSRILPPAEYPRLAGTLLEPIWPGLCPQARVLVVEDGAELVGCVALVPIWHLDGVWIAPAHRQRASVGRRLLVAARAAVAAVGASEVWMMAMTPESRRLCERMGPSTVLDCDHLAVRIGA